MKKPLTITYTFDFSGSDTVVSEVRLDPVTLEYIFEPRESYPHWVALDFHQCENCPLTNEDFIYCPLAVNLVPIIFWCKDLVSYDEVDLIITSAEREIHARTSLQKAVSSLLGLLMSSSACPKMKFLRPLARFHLPLATHEETIFRAVSAMFLKKYFDQGGNINDQDSLAELKENYHELQNLNYFIGNSISCSSR